MQFANTRSLAAAGPAQPPALMRTSGFPDLRSSNAATQNTFGVAVLCIFLFNLLGRVTDFYLAGFHIPLILSSLTMVFAILSGRLGAALAGRNSLLLIGMTVWMILGLPFSLWRGGSVEILNNWLKSVSAFLLIATLVSTVDEAIRVLKIIAYATLCVAVLSMSHSAMMANRLVLSQGLYSGPNELAYIAVLGVITWGFVISQPGISFPLRVVYIGAGLFTAGLLPRTGSRSGMVSIGVVLILALFRLKPVMRIVVGVGAFMIGSVAFVSLPSDIQLRYLLVFRNNVEISSDDEAMQIGYAEGSSRERTNLLVDSLMVTLHRPVFGVGIGNFGVARTDADLTGGRTRQSYQGTHNTYTQISSEAGIPALIMFLCLMGFSWRDIRRVDRAFADYQDLEARRIRNAAFCLRLLMWSLASYFFFAHIGYDPVHLTLFALATAFSGVAAEALAKRQAGAVKSVAAAATAGNAGQFPSSAHAPLPPVTPAEPERPRYRFGGRLARPRTP